MSLYEKNIHSEITKVDVPTMQIRWWNANMYEFKFPDGTKVLFDPFLPNKEEKPNWAHYDCGFYPKDVDKVDYVVINHTHGDHVGYLKEIYDMYQPVILCHNAAAYRLCKDLDIPFTSVIPFQYDQTLDFGSFKMTTHPCRHTGGGRKPSEGGPDMGTNLEILNEYGSLFNTNFVFTTTNNFRIGFVAGRYDANERNAIIPEELNVMIRQCGTTIRTGKAELLADEFMSTGASILFPLHHEQCYAAADLNAFVAQENEILAQRGYPGRMIFPQRTKWYNLTVGAALS